MCLDIHEVGNAIETLLADCGHALNGKVRQPLRGSRGWRNVRLELGVQHVLDPHYGLEIPDENFVGARAFLGGIAPAGGILVGLAFPQHVLGLLERDVLIQYQEHGLDVGSPTIDRDGCRSAAPSSASSGELDVERCWDPRYPSCRHRIKFRTWMPDEGAVSEDSKVRHGCAGQRRAPVIIVRVRRLRAGCRNRTGDIVFTRDVLYQLS